MSALAMIGGAALDVLGSGISSAIGVKSSRKLRQTAYQDTMNSMRAAGLNPIMAARNGPDGSTLNTPMSQLGSNAIKASNETDLRQAEIDLKNRQGSAIDNQGTLYASQNRYWANMADQADVDAQVKFANLPAQLKLAGWKDSDIWAWMEAYGGHINQGINSASSLIGSIKPKPPVNIYRGPYKHPGGN